MAALLTSGCSILLVDKPTINAGKVECTREMTFPVVDGAIAVTSIATPFIYELWIRDRSTQDPQLALSAVLWGAGLATAISAVIGYSRVGRCRRLMKSIELTTPAPTPSAPMAPPPPPPTEPPPTP
ncbi:MAG TPA: hypothetical protein VIV11_09205 [Kofleriaceae bacterium]